MVLYSSTNITSNSCCSTCGLFIVWLILRVQFSEKWAGVYGDAVFTFIVVWKFSIIVTDFKAVIAQPFSLLYFNGGTMGVLLGEWQRRYSFGGSDNNFSLMQLESPHIVGQSF